jgi:hypothetical protein
MKKNLIVFALAITGLLMGGCAKVPEAEIAATTAAIEKAKLAEADVYLQAEYSALQDSMGAINAEVEVQKSKLFASYTVVKEQLAALQVRSAEVEVNAGVRKQEITAEVNALYTQLQTLAAENLALTEQAPKGKEGKAAIEAIKGELSAIDASTAEVFQLLEGGKLLAAQAKATAAVEKANAINAELKAVIEKYGKKNK